MRAVGVTRRGRDRGSQVVEFAILVPVLLVIVTGLVYFGLFFWSQSTLQQAAREGARYVAICNTDSVCVSGTATKVKNNTPGWLGGTNVTVVSNCLSGSGQATVKVSYKWDILGFSATATGEASTPCGG
jgi:Flp pilus assembly protein TadG